jgi:hypothetical protein
VVAGSEIEQFFNIVPLGSFDCVELLAYVAAWKAASMSINALVHNDK